MVALATKSPFGSRRGKPFGSATSSGGSAIVNVSPAVVESGTHHFTSVRTGSESRGSAGVTVMSSTGLGMVAASTGIDAAMPEAAPATMRLKARTGNRRLTLGLEFIDYHLAWVYCCPVPGSTCGQTTCISGMVPHQHAAIACLLHQRSPGVAEYPRCGDNWTPLSEI